MEKLFATVCEDDAPRWASLTLHRFGSLLGALSASPEELKAVFAGERVPANLLHAVQCAMQGALRTRIEDRPIIANDVALLDYLRASMAFARGEEFRVLFFTVRNRLLADEQLFRGTIDAVPVYVREIVQRALDVGAVALIVVHNHPSGDLTPSTSDKAITRDLCFALRMLHINLVDHVIVGATGSCSFRKLGLL